MAALHAEDPGLDNGAPDPEPSEPPGPDIEALLRGAPRAILYILTALALAALVILWMLWASPAWL